MSHHATAAAWHRPRWLSFSSMYVLRLVRQLMYDASCTVLRVSGAETDSSGKRGWAVTKRGHLLWCFSVGISSVCHTLQSWTELT